MKKIIAQILLLAVLCLSLTACGGQEATQTTAAGQASSEEMEEITDKLLADWYTYIVRCEYLYGDMRWALSYLEPFFADHSWDSLQIARAAMSESKFLAESLEPPKMQMTFDEYDRLIQSGADVIWVQPTIDNFLQVLKNEVPTDYQTYRNYLNSPGEQFFLTYGLSHFESWADLMRQIYDIYLLDCAVKTDYLLSTIDAGEKKELFIEAVALNCPRINACRKDNPQDPDALLEKAASLNDERETLANKLSSVVGQAQANLDLYWEPIALDETADEDDIADYISAISADAVDLRDFPIALPYPDWWYAKNNESFKYTWYGGESWKDGDYNFIRSGDTIETPPDMYRVKWEDVSLEEYQDYIRLLESFKIPAQTTIEEDGIYTTFYKYKSPQCLFMITWEENTVSLFTMEGSVCFAPPWYIFYTRGIS